jgi:hypothetical protein
MICELLINGTLTLTVPSCIHTVYKTLYKEEPDELPSGNFLRECHVLVEVVGETLTAIKLANAPQWSQLWTNSTTRCRVPFTALIIGASLRVETLILLSYCLVFSWKMRHLRCK